MSDVFPPFLNLKNYEKEYKRNVLGMLRNRILEIGCGSGLTLLQVCSKIVKSSECICINKRGYRMSQSEIGRDLIRVAEYFNEPVLCTNQSQVILPVIKVIPGLQSKSTMRVLIESVDIILSQHALNEGKLQPREITDALPSIIGFLNPGGLAVLHLLEMLPTSSVLFPNLHLTKSFQIVKILNLSIKMSNDILYQPNKYSSYIKSNVTLMFYFKADALNVVIRRCIVGEYIDEIYGCILPPFGDILTYKKHCLLNRTFMNNCHESFGKIIFKYLNYSGFTSFRPPLYHFRYLAVIYNWMQKLYKDQFLELKF